MITLIHGDDSAKAREHYNLLKQNNSSHIVLEGTALDVTTLTQSLSGDGLFEDNKAIFIENLLTKKKKSKELDELIKTLNSFAGREIILFESKELEKKALSAFPASQVKSYILPQAMFLFLDGLKPKAGPQLVNLFHQVLKTVEIEVLFAMIVRQLRLLLAVGGKTDDPIEEVKRMQPWQEQKLKKQRSLFAEDELSALYSNLFELDYQQKTGRLSLPLSSAIDILLLKL